MRASPVPADRSNSLEGHHRRGKLSVQAIRVRVRVRVLIGVRVALGLMSSLSMERRLTRIRQASRAESIKVRL